MKHLDKGLIKQWGLGLMVAGLAAFPMTGCDDGGGGGSTTDDMGGGAGGMGGGAGGQGGAGGAPPVCGATLQLREACDPGNDCCDRGLICVDLGEEAQCLRTCDANAEVTRCGEREVCIPDDPEVPNGEPSPGFCVPGDDCVPGQEDLSCGEGATCARNDPASFCFPAGMAGEGQECTFSTMQPEAACQTGLVCELGICRRPCGDNDACGEGERCIDYTDSLDGVQWKFCFSGCNVYTQEGCAANEACIFAEEDQDGLMMGACVEATSGMLSHGEQCVADDQTYWGGAGGCTAGHYCGDFLDTGTDQCWGFCDASDNSLCTGNSLCVTPFFVGLKVGVCFGECNGFTGEGCGEGEGCNPFTIANADGFDTWVGLCAEAPAATVGTGEPCQSDDNTGASNCDPGHLCAVLQQGAPAECIKLCDIYEDSGNGCPPGFGCQTEIFGGDEAGNGANPNLGICLPQG
ncbi:MAG: hypothetical protein KC613_19030 [Myxococcales bacterium]|nr:hypothetical protein [Myxococcales bacterium]